MWHLVPILSSLATMKLVQVPIIYDLIRQLMSAWDVQLMTMF